MDRTDWRKQETIGNNEFRLEATLPTFQVCNLKQLISILRPSSMQMQNGRVTLVYLIAGLWESNELRPFPSAVGVMWGRGGHAAGEDEARVWQPAPHPRCIIRLEQQGLLAQPGPALGPKLIWQATLGHLEYGPKQSSLVSRMQRDLPIVMFPFLGWDVQDATICLLFSMGFSGRSLATETLKSLLLWKAPECL